MLCNPMSWCVDAGIQQQLQAAKGELLQVQQSSAAEIEQLQQAEGKSAAALKQAKQTLEQVHVSSNSLNTSSVGQNSLQPYFLVAKLSSWIFLAYPPPPPLFFFCLQIYAQQ